MCVFCHKGLPAKARQRLESSYLHKLQNKFYGVLQLLSRSSPSRDLIVVIQKRSNLKCLLVNVEEDWIRDLGTRCLYGPLCN